MQGSVTQLVHLASTVKLLAALCQILVALQFGVSILNHGFTQYPSRDLTGRKHSCLVCQDCHKTGLSILSLCVLCLVAETTFPPSFLLASFTNTGSKCASHKRSQNSAKKHAHKIQKPLSTSSTFRSKERARNLPA